MPAKLILDANGEVPRETLLAWLAELEEVEHRILSGQQVTSVQYSSLGGGQGVTKQQVSLTDVRARKADIRQRLGLVTQRRRAIGVRYN